MMSDMQNDVAFVEPEPWSVLIVEDIAIHAKILAEAISQFRHPTRIIIANNGLEALQLIERGSIDIAFVDLTLPSLSGADLVRAARDAQKMPFYTVISASQGDRVRDVMREMHAYEYLEKPFDKEDVFRVLRTFLRTRVTQKILIIDDSATARKLVRKILSRSIFSVDVYEAENGISGLEEIAACKADIIFLDMNMEGISGFDTYRVLKAFSTGVRVIFMSASDEAFSGLTDVDPRFKFKKPFGPREIDEVMHIIYGIPLPYGGICHL